MDAASFLMANWDPKAPAVIDAHGTLAFSDLAGLTAGIASTLTALDLPPGSRVALHGPNSGFWIASYLATMRLGLVAVPFPATFGAQDWEQGAQWVDARVILTAKPNSTLPKLPLITPADCPDDALAKWPDPDTIDRDSDALLLFTSGSTGSPRAVRLTHANIMANTASIIEYLDLNSDDRMMVVLPFTYSFGVSLLHTHLRVGGSMVLANSFVFPERILDLIASTECTGFAGVPSSFQLLLRSSTLRSRSLPHLRQIQQAGGKLSPVLVEELIAAQPQARVFLMYGQTEATARLSYLPPELALVKRGSIGRGIPGVTLRVVGAQGSPVAPGEVGEVLARGANISPGYFRDPEASSRTFVDDELHTGDLATIDEEGFITIVDRAADFIKSWGYRISSQEVENAAMTHPDLVAAAAVGLPDEDAGETVALFAVRRPHSQVSSEDVRATCRGALAKHMVPAKVVFLPSLPLNSNGKVSKAALRGSVNKVVDISGAAAPDISAVPPQPATKEQP